MQRIPSTVLYHLSRQNKNVKNVRDRAENDGGHHEIFYGKP
jgi:hypothetical protein